MGTRTKTGQEEIFKRYVKRINCLYEAFRKARIAIKVYAIADNFKPTRFAELKQHMKDTDKAYETYMECLPQEFFDWYYPVPEECPLNVNPNDSEYVPTFEEEFIQTTLQERGIYQTESDWKKRVKVINVATMQLEAVLTENERADTINRLKSKGRKVIVDISGDVIYQ